MEASFSIGEAEYKLNKINAIKQFHVVRRITPILADLLPVIQASNKKAKDFAKLPEDEQFELSAKFVSPVMMGLSRLSDEDADYVLFSLLHSVEAKVHGAWTRIATPDHTLMIQNMDLPLMMQIASRAFMFNLSGFFDAAPLK